MKKAIVHDWIVDIGGAEKTLQSLNKVVDGDVFALLYNDQSAKKIGIDLNKLAHSFIQNMPFAKSKYRYYFPLFPLAVEQFDLSSYDVVVSSSHSYAKGALTNANQLHICYCYTPVRYAWDLYHRYLKDSNLEHGLMGWIAKTQLHKIRIWDQISKNRPDHYIAISNYIAQRINKVYGVVADVIYPPVDVDDFSLEESKDNYYVTASRMVPYKKIDLIVEAFSQMPDKKLVVIGDGPEMKKVRSKAGDNVELLGHQSFEVLRHHLQKAKAFIFAAEEDFGIVPIEAQACGTPVIAYGKGGSLETIANGTSGIFFNEQTISSLKEAIERFEEKTFDPKKVRQNALKFSRARFEKEFDDYLTKKEKEFFQGK